MQGCQGEPHPYWRAALQLVLLQQLPPVLFGRGQRGRELCRGTGQQGKKCAVLCCFALPDLADTGAALYCTGCYTVARRLPDRGRSRASASRCRHCAKSGTAACSRTASSVATCGSHRAWWGIKNLLTRQDRLAAF